MKRFKYMCVIAGRRLKYVHIFHGPYWCWHCSLSRSTQDYLPTYLVPSNDLTAFVHIPCIFGTPGPLDPIVPGTPRPRCPGAQVPPAWIVLEPTALTPVPSSAGALNWNLLQMTFSAQPPQVHHLPSSALSTFEPTQTMTTCFLSHLAGI